MKNPLPYALCAIAGGLYGALGVFLSGVFLRNLGPVAGWILGVFKVNAEISSQVTDALLQLKSARIVSPYFPFVLAFAVLGTLIFHIVRKKRSLVIRIAAWLLLLIFVSLLSSLFTHVNDIRFLDMVKVLISIVSNL